MSELTKERLEEIASGQNTVSIPEAAELARELLSLRTRDAGDEVVENSHFDKLFIDAMHGIGVDEPVNLEGCKSSQRSLEELHSHAIARGNQLREAREEIERLKGLYEQAMRERDAVTGELVSLQNKLTLDEGQFVGEDNSDTPQVWVWDGARSEFESAEPSRRLPFTRRQKPKEVCDE